MATEIDTIATEYLIFGIGKEHYGIDILKVKEIRSYTVPTKMANTPAFFKGIIDLRGTVVPILDSRIKFNLPNVEYKDTTVVIVVTVNDADFGIVVDQVEEVVSFKKGEIQQTPEMHESLVSTDSIIGIGNREGEKMTILVDASMFIGDLQHQK